MFEALSVREYDAIEDIKYNASWDKSSGSISMKINTTETAEAILRIQDKTPNGVVRDADTVLQDIMDNMERDVTVSGFELIHMYLSSHDRVGFCRLFEAMTGTTWTSYLDETLRVMTKVTQPEEEPAVGEWLNVQEEELYVPDKHFTTYHTSQTCSVCGVRTRFVGQKPYISEQYCPSCGKQMNPRWTFQHQPVSNEMQLTGYQHDGTFQHADDVQVTNVPFEPKNLNEINQHQSGNLD